MSNEFFSAIDQISNKDLYIWCEPDVPDITSNQPVCLVICAKELEIKIPMADNSIKGMLGILKEFIGGENRILVAWNIKNFFTWVKAKTGVDFSFNGNILDLAIIEKYLGMNFPKPDGFIQAFQRIQKLMTNPVWGHVYNIYNQVYRPLLESLPEIESLGLIRKNKKQQKVFCHYDIDGQINGRFNCYNAFKNSFNPHNLSAEEKSSLYPIGFDNYFVHLDIKHMEVSMLQWLTKDRFLGDIIENHKDAYREVWKALTGKECTEASHRKIAKECLLPVVYGLKPYSMSQDLNIPLEMAKKLIDKIYKIIPDSMTWIETQQDSIQDNKIKDYFGRVRDCDTAHKVRNFSVQSPAALVCTHKLGKLAKCLKGLATVSMYIHDGYVLVCHKNNIKEVINKGRKIIGSDDELYPGLKFEVAAAYGPTLNQLELV